MLKPKLRHMHSFLNTTVNEQMFIYKEIFDDIYSVYSSTNDFAEKGCIAFTNATLELMPKEFKYQFYKQVNILGQYWFVLIIKHPGSCMETFKITTDDGDFNCN